MAVALYIGMRKGTEKTVDIVIERLRKRFGGSPTAKRLERLLESADRLLGDEELAGQATRFFKEAADLVSSREARDFFASLAEFLKSMTARPPMKEVVKLGAPSKKEAGAQAED
jgi:hypothetical protein